VSSQDFSPAPYPLYAEAGTGEPYALPEFRTRERYWLHSLLFALTLLTTTVVGAAMQSDFNHNIPFDVERAFDLYSWIWRHPLSLLHGLPFSLTLMTILLAHEFGHYLAAMYHRVDASLPYFLPSPFLGTFGAFIKVRSPIYSKRVLFDIGVSGPIAGFVFVLPALAIGLAFSKVIPGIVHQGSLQFGVPGLERLLELLIFPGAASADIYLHPVARAAWVGMFTTALNLLPIGQLDGGHILYSFFPQRHRLVSRLVALALLPLGCLWLGWLLWGLGMLWLGRHHPMIFDNTDLGAGRRQLALAALIVFILCFMVIPLREGGL
jgi:membrane-associated protease RseP (regulator of RpoE activity)